MPPPPPPPPPEITPLLDHVVILVPHSFLTSPPAWFADGELFHFYPGGRHTDGRTENTLVLLPDGSYLEFIAFAPGLDPRERASHRWGRGAEGSVIDWAVTLHEKTFQDFRARVRDARTGIAYADLARGGRARPDGAELKWAVAAAERAPDPTASGGTDAPPALLEPGTVPFWCLDVTDRDLRVPYRGEAARRRRHPSGAVGVATVHVRVPRAAEAESIAVYDVLLGEREKKVKGDADEGHYYYWGIGTLEGGVGNLHPGGEVRLAGAAQPGVDIELFTDDEALDGKVVGGKVDEQHSLSIRLVATSRRR
ncbi:glyoxalase-like domain-containing protein [Biscogniauxia marginata]|nr:glyoxalase-like domain-containing protein [Biscogniauxia marginata]